MAKIKLLVAIVQKHVIVIDADGLAITRVVAHLAAYALRIGCRRKYEGGGQRASANLHDRDRMHGSITLRNYWGSESPRGAKAAGSGRDRSKGLPGKLRTYS
jgi:hypothetical protein